MTFKKFLNIAGWLVFAITATVFFFSVETTGSLWDCGEFIAGAYKLEVVHPPGAALFVMIGRMFVLVAQALSDDPRDISFAVNFMSGLSTAMAAVFVCWTTGILTKMTLVGRDGETSFAESLVSAAAGVVAGLGTAFSVSIWFSAVEGEVYALSTMFTALVVWATVKWYHLPNERDNDRWLFFALYMAGLSIGVHLLSLLTFPAMAMLIYFKKFQNHSYKGMGLAFLAGLVLMQLIQSFVIIRVTKIWAWFEMLGVNSFGLPQHYGVFLAVMFFAAIIVGGLYYAHSKHIDWLQKTLVGFTLVLVGYSTIGLVVIRANAGPPINMNNNDNVLRLIPYLNREQYGERPLLFGPDFTAEIQGADRVEDRYDYDPASKSYVVTDQKLEYNYKESDKKFFPRLGHNEGARPELYQRWGVGVPPKFSDNVSFFINYQVRWMYWRYFMWNFSGRQNAEQGFYSWDSKNGNWITGIGFIDKMLLGYSAADETKVMKEDRGRNAYYLLPFIFGLIGLFYHFKKRPEEALSIMVLFLMTGLAITVYTNQPPNEPRERDYVLVGSFFTFCIWMGMGVAAIYEYIKNKMPQVPAAALASALVLVAPVLMGTQNYDDMSRRGHTAASDYASNFLNSVGKNAIIFTYGDNDTYPLWYAQEVENIRPDVRVVNLSLIQVDWYIDHLRRKVNESPYIKMTLPKESYNGKKMNQVVYYPSGDKADFASVQSIMQFLGKQQGDQMYVPTNKLYIPIDSAQMLAQGGIQPTDAGKMLPQIPFEMPMKKSGQYQYTTKGDLALVDIVASNINDRPIYFATTIPDPNENFLGLAGFTQLEGLALRIVPIPYGEDKRFAGIGAMSLGNVNDDIIYDNMMHKWKWGNFDKAPTFVDSKYGPSVQSMRMAFIRGARSLLDRGDTTRAVQMIDKYFEAFPNFNFPYDYSILEFMRLYVDAKAWDKAKPQAQILADNLEDQLAFCMTLDDSALKSSEFYRDFRIALSAKDQLLGFVTKAGDTAFKAELDKRFEAYKTNGDNQSEQ